MSFGFGCEPAFFDKIAVEIEGLCEFGVEARDDDLVVFGGGDGVVSRMQDARRAPNFSDAGGSDIDEVLRCVGDGGHDDVFGKAIELGSEDVSCDACIDNGEAWLFVDDLRGGEYGAGACSPDVEFARFDGIGDGVVDVIRRHESAQATRFAPRNDEPCTSCEFVGIADIDGIDAAFAQMCAVLSKSAL